MTVQNRRTLRHSSPPDQPDHPVGSPSRQQVWRMFDRIAPRYDLLNRLLSLRQDVRWRKKLSDCLPAFPELRVLDLATGTADVLLSLFRYSRRVSRGVGADMAQQMLRLGREKVREQGVEQEIHLLPADAMYLPFHSGSFEVVTIAFGIRNVLDVSGGLQEMYRVLKSGGRVLILEFSLPRHRLVRGIYLLYFRYLLPLIGGVISGDSAAYRYLNQTVETFPYGQKFAALMEAAGFTAVKVIPLTLGIAAIYCGDKTGS